MRPTRPGWDIFGRYPDAKGCGGAGPCFHSLGRVVASPSCGDSTRAAPKPSRRPSTTSKVSFGRTIHPPMTSIDGRCSGAAKAAAVGVAEEGRRDRAGSTDDPIQDGKAVANGIPTVTAWRRERACTYAHNVHPSAPRYACRYTCTPRLPAAENRTMERNKKRRPRFGNGTRRLWGTLWWERLIRVRGVP